jgi:hypothetical protein
LIRINLGAVLANKHRRRDAVRTSSSRSQAGLIDRTGRREAALKHNAGLLGSRQSVTLVINEWDLYRGRRAWSVREGALRPLRDVFSPAF